MSCSAITPCNPLRQNLQTCYTSTHFSAGSDSRDILRGLSPFTFALSLSSSSSKTSPPFAMAAQARFAPPSSGWLLLCLCGTFRRWCPRSLGTLAAWAARPMALDNTFHSAWQALVDSSWFDCLLADVHHWEHRRLASCGQSRQEVQNSFFGHRQAICHTTAFRRCPVLGELYVGYTSLYGPGRAVDEEQEDYTPQPQCT